MTKTERPWLEPLMLAYRYADGDPDVGTTELRDALCNAICEAIGDEEFQRWNSSQLPTCSLQRRLKESRVLTVDGRGVRCDWEYERIAKGQKWIRALDRNIARTCRICGRVELFIYHGNTPAWTPVRITDEPCDTREDQS